MAGYTNHLTFDERAAKLKALKELVETAIDHNQRAKEAHNYLYTKSAMKWPADIILGRVQAYLDDCETALTAIAADAADIDTDASPEVRIGFPLDYQGCDIDVDDGSGPPAKATISVGTNGNAAASVFDDDDVIEISECSDQDNNGLYYIDSVNHSTGVITLTTTLPGGDVTGGTTVVLRRPSTYTP